MMSPSSLLVGNVAKVRKKELTMATAKKLAQTMVADNNEAAPINGNMPTDQVQLGDVELINRKETGDSAKTVGVTTEKKTIFTTIRADDKKRLDARHNVLQLVTQQLAEAFDLYQEGDGKQSEASKVADKAGSTLYKASSAGIVTKEEVSATLRDVFGAKMKGDGKMRVTATDPNASKTPFGKGEDIRKRIVRASEARQHLDGTESKFFSGLDENSEDKDGLTLGELVGQLDRDEVSIWTAYTKFADIKNNYRERSVLAFNAERIAEMVKSLREEGAGETLRNSPTLVAAYAALIDVLNFIGEEE